MVFPVVIPTFVLIFRLRVLLLAAASSVLAASYLGFSYTPPPGTSQRAGVSARFSERSEVGCVFNSLQRWVRDKSPRVSGER